MALPGGVTPVVVTGKVASNKNVAAASGTVTFRMPYALSDGTDHVVLAPGVWSFPIAADGTINTAADPMPAATSAGVSPAGWSYEVTVRAVMPDASVWFRRFFVQINANASFEQLVAAASPTPAPPAAYVPLSAVGTSVAPLVAGKVPTQYLPPGGGGSGVATVTAANGTIVVNSTDPANPTVRVGAGIPQASVATLTSDLGTLTAGISSAVSAANGAATAAAAASTAAGNAQTAATAAQATADAAQSTASAAYVKPGPGIPPTDLTSAAQAELTAASTAYQKPGPGIPKADLVAAVQASLGLADTAIQVVPPQPNPDAYRWGGHSCNVPLLPNATSTINGEAWAAIVPVRAGVPIVGAFVFRSDGTGVFNGTSGLNGFAVFDIPAGGGPGALLGSSVSDDTMWQPLGKIDKPISGVPTPTVDGARLVVVNVRNYSDAPEFSFINMAGQPSIGNLFAKYRGGGFTSWPSTIDVATDLATGSNYVLPVFIR